ncbi:uncharacterized protein LOC113799650 [Dermatophagoides pteronyssinus]|uniref:uncharacterized protein LOC113799650 n=1 Tax=Dermatophagoides pteronyssinus TaxID=6956 RepID=UPI003F671AA1
MDTIWLICIFISFLILLMIFIAAIAMKVSKLQRSACQTREQLSMLEASMVKVVSHITNDLKIMANTDNLSAEKNSFQCERQKQRRLETFGSISSKHRNSLRNLKPLLRFHSRSSSKCLSIHQINDHDKKNINGTSFRPLDTENFPFVSREDSCIINVINEDLESKLHGNSATKERSSINYSMNSRKSPNINGDVEGLKQLDTYVDHHKPSDCSSQKLFESVKEEFDKSFNRVMDVVNQENTVDFDTDSE